MRTPWTLPMTPQLRILPSSRPAPVQFTTVSFEHALGVERSIKNEELIGKRGCARFLSHKAYTEWAKTHGDVFKVDVKITSHDKYGPAQWTR